MRRKNKQIYTLDGSSFSPEAKRKRALQTLKKIAISIIVLIVVFTLFGFGYSLWTNQAADPNSAKTDAAADKALSAKPFVAKPTKPAANAPVGVAVYLESLSVKAGTNTSATARTVAGASCTVVFEYSGVSSHDSGLVAKKADDYGTVNWTWTIDPSVPAGSWPVRVTCAYNGRSGVGQAKIDVTK